MNAQAGQIISAARRYLGVKESPPGSNSVVFNVLYYGRSVSGSAYPWCCAFVWCVFRETGLSDLFYGGGKTASCTTLMNYAKKNRQFHTANYRPGDLALFNWNGAKDAAQHIGIVTEVRTGAVVTIEGNTALGNDSDGGGVMERVRPISTVIGVYRPKYKEESMDTDKLRRELTDISGTGDGHSSWADGAIEELIRLGLFKGDGAGNYGWGQLVTREALAQVIFNLLDIIKNKE